MNSVRVQANWESFYSTPNHILLTSLEQPFAKEEIKKVTFSFGADKTLVLMLSSSNASHSAQQPGFNLDMSQLNFAHFTLIPKKKEHMN